jgi:hypothetical protein
MADHRGLFENKLRVDLQPIYNAHGIVERIRADDKVTRTPRGFVLREVDEPWSEVLGRLREEVRTRDGRAEEKPR